MTAIYPLRDGESLTYTFITTVEIAWGDNKMAKLEEIERRAVERATQFVNSVEFVDER